MRYFQSIIFIGTRTFGDIFKSALVYLYWSIKFPQKNINQSENGTGDKNLSVERLSIFFRKLITRNTLYVLCERPTYLRWEYFH